MTINLNLSPSCTVERFILTFRILTTSQPYREASLIVWYRYMYIVGLVPTCNIPFIYKYRGKRMHSLPTLSKPYRDNFIVS